MARTTAESGWLNTVPNTYATTMKMPSPAASMTYSGQCARIYSPLCCRSLATRPVQPVWWLAPMPAPLSP
jgi:hypothetical protein